MGLVAGMFEALGIPEVIDRATKQNSEMRLVTAGHAVKAMGLNGFGFINQQLHLVPHFFQNKPISRLIAPSIQASHLNDDSLLDRPYANSTLASVAERWTHPVHLLTNDERGQPPTLTS